MILCDSREHYASYTCDKFRENGIESEVVCLPYPSGCDYLITNTHGSCGVQRKDSMAELAGQMEELRHDILPRLITFTDNPVLLVEESHIIGERGYLFQKRDKLWVETSLHCSSYYGFLETVRNMGVDVVCTRNLDQSIWYMASIHGYLGKMHYPKHIKTFKADQQAIGAMCCVPGIGERKAEKALSSLSLLQMATSDSVPGLTKIQLEKLKKMLLVTI